MALFGEKKDADVQAPIDDEIIETTEETLEEVYVDTTADEVAFISSSTKIDGNISTQGNVVLSGQIDGKTIAKGSVVVTGKSNGDIECDSVLLDGCEQKSNIIAANNVVVKANTSCNGNINCKNITVYGTVNGDIKASGSVVLKETAVINGAITAARIGIESGAKLSSTVTIK